jgi:hypothetical protein
MKIDVIFAAYGVLVVGAYFTGINVICINENRIGTNNN